MQNQSTWILFFSLISISTFVAAQEEPKSVCDIEGVQELHSWVVSNPQKVTVRSKLSLQKVNEFTESDKSHHAELENLDSLILDFRQRYPKRFQPYDNCDQIEIPDSGVFEENKDSHNSADADSLKLTGDANISHIVSDWQLVFSETFEGSFPGSWATFSQSSVDAYWDDQSYMSYSGDWSAWCADEGSDGLDASGGFYHDNMYAWMKIGPFDLSDASDAELIFYLNLDTEPNYDKFHYWVSINEEDPKNWTVCYVMDSPF